MADLLALRSFVARTITCTGLYAAVVGCGDQRGTQADAARDGSITDAAPLATPTCAAPVRGTQVRPALIAKFPNESVVQVTAPPAAANELFFVLQSGVIHRYRDGLLVAGPFLDLSRDSGGPVIAGGEMGLLGLAFHPNYAQNGKFFVYYTGRGTNVVAEYTANATRTAGERASARELLRISDPFANHNGGMLAFGPDGYLYIGTGDGGSANDPENVAQNPNSLLGKMLRIDVDGATGNLPYRIVTDNPYAQGGGAPEVWQRGLRNPWRWAFDPSTHDMYIADVGQGQWEEVNVVPANTGKGYNFGWKPFEGNTCLHPPCDGVVHAAPQVVKSHNAGWCSIIGGAVYRGSCFPDLAGRYFFTDYCASALVSARFGNGAFSDEQVASGTWPSGPASISQDARGELYLTTTTGDVYFLYVAP